MPDNKKEQIKEGAVSGVVGIGASLHYQSMHVFAHLERLFLAQALEHTIDEGLLALTLLFEVGLSLFFFLFLTPASKMQPNTIDLHCSGSFSLISANCNVLKDGRHFPIAMCLSINFVMRC
jgi:hypothetical protein